MSADHALNSISLRRLKVARFSEANDPFELMALNCLQRDVRKKLNEFKIAQDSQLGMLCFSEAWNSPVLWSHYADGHRGICLGFNVKKTFGVRGVQTVRYEDEKLRALPDRASIAHELGEQLFVTKYKHWEYERELRVLVELKNSFKERGHYFYPFSNEMVLTEVILGHQCSVSVEPICALTQTMNPGAFVIKARLGFKYFEVKSHKIFPPPVVVA